MDIQNIKLYKYLTDHAKTMNREKKGGAGWNATAGEFIYHQNTRQKA
jgi:hypothetical protein